MHKPANQSSFIPVIVFLIMIVIGISKVRSALYFDDREHLIAASAAIGFSLIGLVFMISLIIKNGKKTA